MIMKQKSRRDLTGIDLTAEAQYCLAHARADYRAVLCLIVDGLVLAVLNVLARRFAPRGREGCEGLKFVTWAHFSQSAAEKVS